MFAVDQLPYFDERNEKFKLIKSSRSFAREYLAKALLMVAFIAGVLQVTKDTFVCIPVEECDLYMATKGSNRHCTVYKNAFSTKNMAKSKVIATLQDRRQYDFVDSKCRDIAIKRFPSYWPFILFLEAIVIVLLDSIWLKIPYVSLKMDTFLSLVVECYNISGTVSAISNVLEGERTNPERQADGHEVERVEDGNIVVIPNGDNEGIVDGNEGEIEAENGAEIALLGQQEEILDGNGNGIHNALDKLEIIKVKTLKGKVDQFSEYINMDESQVFTLYVGLGLLRLLATIIIFAIHGVFYSQFEKEVTCKISGTMFDEYKCENGLIAYFILTLNASFVILLLYAVLCLCNSYEVIVSIYDKTFKIDVLDIRGNDQDGPDPDIKGDLAFMLYLLRKCNKMHLLRIALFLLPNNSTNILKYRVWRL